LQYLLDVRRFVVAELFQVEGLIRKVVFVSIEDGVKEVQELLSNGQIRCSRVRYFMKGKAKRRRE
jgi:hypothetical protein